MQLFSGLLLLKYGEVEGSFGNQKLRPLVLSQFHEDCDQSNTCDLKETPVPFLVVSDREGANPEITSEVETRLAWIQDARPEPMAYDPVLETGTHWLYGVEYSDGLPTCDTPAWRPRSDMSDWVDPRHRCGSCASKFVFIIQN